MLTVSTVAALLPSLLLAGVAALTGPGQCVVVDSKGRCLVSAVDSARTPGAGGTREREAPDRSSSRGRPQQPSRDDEREPEPPPSPPQEALPIGSGWTQRSTEDLDRLLAQLEADQERGPAQTATPEVLALRAVRQLDLPAPAVHTSGDDGAVVGVPLWLWVDRADEFAGPVAATATAGSASVTAEARFVGLEWSMGPPGAVVRCDGPGTPWTGQPGPSPDCGYTYRTRSLEERTGGTGRWPVVVTAVWSVTWTGFSAGAPVTGEQEVRVPTTTSLPVGEVQVLVDGDGQ